MRHFLDFEKSVAELEGKIEDLEAGWTNDQEAAQINRLRGSVTGYATVQERAETILKAHGLDYGVEWQLSGQPFLTTPGALVDATVASVREVTGQEPELSTGGGTSDGRFIAPTGAQVVELGPVNASIHKLNEQVLVADLPRLAKIYKGILKGLLLEP